jgi:type IV pilus assembly protein PilB
MKLPKSIEPALISRIKILSNLKIDEQRIPQDGRAEVTTKDNREMDLRVSTLPTVNGEKIVMRLQDKSRKIPDLPELGLDPHNFALLTEALALPNGIILTSGPTGSGKTTTLYSCLNRLNEIAVNIMTIEDPVEYRMQGINQSQIDRSKDYTFAKGLRSILRQDPDIAMVGEIRDLETADIAIQAALTGHLILSTIHTNSASGAIPRFLSMGVKPFLLAPALNCVIGQRLVRLLCQKCKKKVTLSEEQKERVETALANLPQKQAAEIAQKEKIFYTGGGCEACHGIGYKGRVGIYEIFIMSQVIEQLILTGQVSEFEIEKIAVQNGMVTMVQDGLMKALEGKTSVDEVFRVIE